MRARVVGLGSIGCRYARILREHFGFVVHGVTSRQDIGILDGIVSETRRQRRLDEVDLTVVSSRTGRHVQDAERYLSFTSSMIIEKPLAINAAEAYALANARILQSISVAAPLRHMGGYRAVQELLAQFETIDDVVVVSESWLPQWRPTSNYQTSYSADPDEGGVLRDQIHEIDYALDLFGMPTRLRGILTAGSALGVEAEGRATMHWQYETFNLAMVLDFMSPSPRRILQVKSGGRTLTWDILVGSVTLGAPDNRSWSFERDTDRDRLMIAEIESALEATDETTQASVSAAIRALHVVDLARISDRAGGLAISVG